MNRLKIVLIFLGINISAITAMKKTNYIGNYISTIDWNDPDATTIMVNSAYIDGKVRLKWLVTDINLWEHGLNVGYTIERVTISESGNFLSKNERLDSYVLLQHNYLPKPISALQLASSNPNEGTLANILVNDPSTMETIRSAGADGQTLENAVKQKQMRDMRYMYSHVLAEKNFDMACAMGMAFEDDSTEQNKQYAYIITLSEPLN